MVPPPSSHQRGTCGGTSKIMYSLISAYLRSICITVHPKFDVFIPRIGPMFLLVNFRPPCFYIFHADGEECLSRRTLRWWNVMEMEEGNNFKKMFFISIFVIFSTLS